MITIPTDRYVDQQMTNFRKTLVKKVKSEAEKADNVDLIDIYKITKAKVFPDLKITIKNQPEYYKKRGDVAISVIDYINKTAEILLDQEQLKKVDTKNKNSLAYKVGTLVHETAHPYKYLTNKKELGLLKKTDNDSELDKANDFAHHFERSVRRENSNNIKELFYKSAKGAGVNFSETPKKQVLDYIHVALNHLKQEKLAYKHDFTAYSEIMDFKTNNWKICFGEKEYTLQTLTDRYKQAEKAVKEIFAENAGERLRNIAKGMFNAAKKAR